MAAKLLPFSLLIFGLLSLRATYGQYEGSPDHLDAHTDPNAYGEAYDYDQFSPDESDIKSVYNAAETQENNDKQSDDHHHKESVEHSQEKSIYDTVNHHSDQNHVKEENTGTTNEITVEDVLRQEQRTNEMNNLVADDTNSQIRDDLHTAQQHDNFRKRSENEPNNGRDYRNHVESGERPIKQIHDTVAEGEHKPVEVQSNGMARQEQERKEHKGVKISKLIFSGKKNGDDANKSSGTQSDLSSESPQPTNSQSSDSSDIKSAVDGDSHKPWINEIVMTDGGLLQVKNNPNHIVDLHKESSDQNVASSNQEKEKSDESITGDHQNGKDSTNQGERNTGSRNVHQETFSLMSDTPKQSEGNAGVQQNAEHQGTVEIVKQEDSVTQRNSEGQGNHEKRDEDQDAGQISRPNSDAPQSEDKLDIDDEKIFESKRFIEMKDQYISRYMNDHYRDKAVSPQLLKQITDLLTNDLKEQYKRRRKELILQMEEREKQSSTVEQKDGQSGDGNSQKDDQSGDGNSQKDYQSGDGNSQIVEQESTIEGKSGYQEVEKVNVEQTEVNTSAEPSKRPERTDSRPVRSFLSSMVRSSLSLNAHEKHHESSLSIARSSPLAATMAADGGRSDDVLMNSVSTSVSDVLSTVMPHLKSETSYQESTSNTDQLIASSEIDVTRAVDPNRKANDIHTDIYAKSKNDSRGGEDGHSSFEKGLEQGRFVPQTNGTVDPSQNETHQEDSSKYAYSDSDAAKDKMYKAGDPFELSLMSDPDPKINRLIQLPVFQDLRKTQIQSYIDAQFAGKYLSEGELNGIVDLISQSMRKDLNDENSGLYAWISESMGGEGFENEAEPSPNTTESVESESNTNENAGQDVVAKSEHKETEDQSSYIEDGTSQEVADIIKAKRKELLEGSSSSHHGDGTMETIVDNRKELHEDAKNENEAPGDVEKESGGSYLDSIWGFFGGSTEEAASEEKESPVVTNSISDRDKLEEEPSNSVESEESITLTAAEEEEEETGSSDKGDGFTQATNQPATTPATLVEYETTATSNEPSSEESKPASSEESKPASSEESKPAATASKTSVFINNIISKDPADDKFPTSSSSSQATDGSPIAAASTTKSTTMSSAPNITDNANREEYTTVVEEAHTSQKPILEEVESIDKEHEMSKYQETSTVHEPETKNVEVDEGIETDPLKKLCKKYPALKACQESKPPEPPPQTEETMDTSFASYIKFFTKWMNSYIYAVFAYIVQCLKSLARILCVTTVGTFLNILGREQISHSIMEDFDAVTTEQFAGYIFLLISYAGFGWYYKNSTMNPVIKVSDGYNDKVGDQNVKDALNQLNGLKKEVQEENNRKEEMQQQLEKEIDINKQMHKENKDLKKYIEENKGDKKRMKELSKSIKDHENKMKGKDNELEKLRISIQTVKDDLKESKDKYKLLEDKFRYVEKESDSKDDTIAELEDRRKELEKELCSRDEDITEKEDVLEDLNKRVDDLQARHLELENNMEREKEITRTLEEERKMLQETLLKIDKINYDGTLENGFHSIDGEDGVLNVSLDDDVKAERLQNIINAIKLKAEHLEAVTELNTCKEDLTVYRTKADELEVNMNDLSSKFETLSSESVEMKKGIEKKNIELQTITKFFGEREAEFQRLNVSQKDEIQKLSKQMDLIGDEKREMSELIKKIDELKEEIENNQKDYKQQLSTVEEQSHANYLKMRNAIRECDEHKREKEVYRKRLLDIDMTPQTKTKTTPVAKPPVSLDRSDSPGSNRSNENTPETSASNPPQPPLPTSAPPFGRPPMFRGGVPNFPPNPMASALYRVPPVGPYGMPARPPFMPMRPPLPPNAHMNTANIPQNPTNTSIDLTTVQTNTSMSATGAPFNSQNVPVGNSGAPFLRANAPMNVSTARMNSQVTPLNPIGAPMHSQPRPYSTPGQPLQAGQHMAMPPHIRGMYRMPPGAPMMANLYTQNMMTGPGHPTSMSTPEAAATGVPLKNS